MVRKTTVILTNHRNIKHFYKNHKLSNLRKKIEGGSQTKGGHEIAGRSM